VWPYPATVCMAVHRERVEELLCLEAQDMHRCRTTKSRNDARLAPPVVAGVVRALHATRSVHSACPTLDNPRWAAGTCSRTWASAPRAAAAPATSDICGAAAGGISLECPEGLLPVPTVATSGVAPLAHHVVAARVPGKVSPIRGCIGALCRSGCPLSLRWLGRGGGDSGRALCGRPADRSPH